MYENLPNVTSDTTVNVFVKLTKNNQKSQIVIDKSTRQYTSDGVRYYLSGDLPEPLRRSLNEESRQRIEVLTAVYLGPRSGNRLMETRSRGLLINWHHPVPNLT